MFRPATTTTTPPCHDRIQNRLVNIWRKWDFFFYRTKIFSAFSEADTEAGEEQRENWGSKWEFIFSCVGLSVGIGNVWRFPKLAYENGGASFLIPYFVILLLIGKPMYYLELALGQFAQRGPIKIWKMCPLGIGVGIGQCIVSIIGNGSQNNTQFYYVITFKLPFTTTLSWDTASTTFLHHSPLSFHGKVAALNGNFLSLKQ